LSYEELAFHLEDWVSFLAKETVVAPDDQRDSPADLGGRQSRLAGQRSTGRAGNRYHVWIDRPVGAALMHQPSDSTLLWDAVRVMKRLLRRAGQLPRALAAWWRVRRCLATRTGWRDQLPPVARASNTSSIGS
jgi:IS5 family transposase